MNPDDAIRDQILRYLYERHRKARSPTSAAIKISDLNAAMRPLGLKANQVGHNLDYLLQKRWAVEVVEERTFKTPRGTTQTSPSRSYKISADGIDLLETVSTYKESPIAQNINITNIEGVTIIGEGNVVSAEFTDVFRLLADLRSQVLATDTISEREKLEVTADVDALQSQLQKPEPDRRIVEALWRGIETSVTTAAFAELIAKGAHLLGPLLG